MKLSTLYGEEENCSGKDTFAFFYPRRYQGMNDVLVDVTICL